jgi:selenocysteine lyase/cysteine desulfurase
LSEQHFETELSENELSGGPNLVVFPAMSNFCGKKFPIEKWIEFSRRKNFRVLLDAAAFVSTSRLDLGKLSPDFVAISFYKIFGYPTGQLFNLKL